MHFLAVFKLIYMALENDFEFLSYKLSKLIKILNFQKALCILYTIMFKYNLFKTNEPFRLVVVNFCSQQIIFTKNWFL